MLKNKKNNKNKTVKQKNQRILSIYSSHQTSVDAVCKGTSLPLKKTNRASILATNTKSKELPRKDKPKNQASTTKIKAPQVYQRIPINLANSNTNSQIQFSNYGESHKEQIRPIKKQLYIDCDDQALIREIWRVGKKRKNLQNEAATKIQKVFRGYLTRKLLLKYAQQYEERLIEQKNRLKRKATFNQYSPNHEDSFYNSELKKSYFQSQKQSKNKIVLLNSQEKPSIFQAQSSIAVNECQHFHSIQDHEFLMKVEQNRKLSFAEPACITLNESSIAQQQEISLSFGQEAQPSPHFVPIQFPSKKKSRPEIMESPSKVEKGISEDKTRDGASQNISMSKQYRSQKQDASNLSSIKKEESLLGKSQVYDLSVQRLRTTEKAKWQQVIELVNSNLQENLNVDRTKVLMSTILQFSVKNREELNKYAPEEGKDPILVTPTTITNRFSDQQHMHSLQQKEALHDFKKKTWENNENQIQNYKGENRPFAKKIEQKQSIFERTQKMKQYFLQNILVQDLRIDKMLQLRQSILRKKESNSLMQLNHMLENNMLTQNQFIERLSDLSSTFHKQKTDIEQTKNEIYQGYKAQLQLYKATALDAKYLGYHLPFSRSMQIFPNCPRWRFDDLMIDQLNSLAQKRKQLNFTDKYQKEMSEKAKLQIEQVPVKIQKQKEQLRQQFFESQEQQSVSFTYQQPFIHKKSQSFSIDITDLAKNQFINSPKNMRHVSPFGKHSAVAVFEQLDHDDELKQSAPLQMQRKIDFKNSSQNEDHEQQKCLKRERYKISDISSDQEDSQNQKNGKDNKKVDQLVNLCINKVVWELIDDIYSSSKIINNLKYKRSKMKIDPATNSQRIQFLQECIANLPSFSIVKDRINQKMYPNSKQLLVSMREIDEDQEQSEYLQIGQYEYILNQQICFTFIESYLQKNNKTRKKTIMPKNSDVPAYFKQEYQIYGTDKLKKRVLQRKFQTAKLRQSVEESRQQILRIQLHSLLDAWNQQLIKNRQNKLGYSGIGLNQISLSLIDRVCRPVTQQTQYINIMKQTKERLVRIVSADNISDSINEDYRECIFSNDSQWILYTQEALQYGFDLAKIIELQLIFECLDQIHSLHGAEKSKMFEGSQSSQFDSLDEQEQQLLQKKIEQMQKYGQSEQQDSFYR